MYYLDDGNIIFLVSCYIVPRQWKMIPSILQVDGILFKVHRYFFLRPLSIFSRVIPYIPSLGLRGGDSGLSDEKPITLLHVKGDEFAHFLWMLYNPCVSPLLFTLCM
jgi:hypothetical protein